jgi:hypothetical protein
MKETLEEVAEKYVDSFEYGIAHPRRVVIKSFINGAKWQQERSYSEEEVINILVEFSADIKKVWNITEWFEQFKK